MIVRNFQSTQSRQFDLLVIGGGIYGASLLRRAARRGIAACLLEAGDFGGGTSWNSLRIVHGGLRYLQTLDLRRFFQSVAARRGIARDFPTLVRPLRCLMPLYGMGVKRTSVLRAALAANDLMSAGRNKGLDRSVWLARSSILDPGATRRSFPKVRRERLQGAACWSDYLMLSSERILIELLIDACRRGASAQNYARVEGVISEAGSVRGVRVRDQLTGELIEIAARCVVNCAGPHVNELGAIQNGRTEPIFAPSLAFNLLLDVDVGNEAGLAVSPPDASAPVLFLVPIRGRLLAGTMHLPRPMGTTNAEPSEAEIAAYLSLLNQAVPSLKLRIAHVRRVFAGLLPAAVPGSEKLARREVIRNEGAVSGLRGLYSVCGVKFTTADDVATETLRLAGLVRDDAGDFGERPVLSPHTELLIDGEQFLASSPEARVELVRRVVAKESVLSPDDLVFRRSNWGALSADVARLRAAVPWPASLAAVSQDQRGCS